MSTMATRASAVTTFTTEADLVDEFVGLLQTGKSYWRAVQITTEWKHGVGFADVLLRTSGGTLVAFEAKLSDWRRAFHQAYRNSSYANRVYVLLPHSVIHRALSAQTEFEYRGIGLCSIYKGKIHVHVKATEQHALLAWVRLQAHEHFDRFHNESCIDAECSTGVLQAA